VRGPIAGDHDAHWYISLGSDTLHIVDGYAWHAGLPLQSLMLDSTDLRVRGWQRDDRVGLDITGRTSDGKFWRWVGATFATAIQYQTPSRRTADRFDRIIATMCEQG
jgi:hypothetical protein